MDKLIAIAAALAVLTVSSGQLHKVFHKLLVAQLQLIKDSQSSTWGQAMLLPSNLKL
ncbi:MAG: hypothetical protein H7336_03225 [Bacteriovorax sp.]|nr:hypothetical protein [Bacteriovorax sp.]